MAKRLAGLQEGRGAESRRRFLGRGAKAAAGAAAVAAVATAGTAAQDGDVEAEGRGKWVHRGWGKKIPDKPFLDFNRRNNYRTKRGPGRNPGGMNRGRVGTAQDAPGSIGYDQRTVGFCRGLCGSFACEGGGTLTSYTCVAENDDRDDNGKFTCYEYIIHDRICGEPQAPDGVTCDYYEYCQRAGEYGLRCEGPADCAPVR